jgi:hypothetical protein
MNGLITYGFGKIYNPGFIVLYGIYGGGEQARPFITLKFSLSIETEINLSLVR